MKSQQEKVKTFFDRAAQRYRQHDAVATRQYFNQRLKLALKQAPSSDAAILDIGCGTGLLYDALDAEGLAKSYLGIDGSPGMLTQSRIPPEKRRRIFFFDFANQTGQRYDFIYALGFTTYLAANDLAHFYQNIYKLLKPEGQAIISFTHKNAYDFRIRAVLNRVFGPILPANRSLGRDFAIYAATPRQVEQDGLAAGLTLTQLSWLPPTLPCLGSFLSTERFGPNWRPDFLVVLRRKEYLS